MIKRSRYSLIHVADDGKITPFSLTFDADGKKVVRNKFPLTQLDALTTRINMDGLYFLFDYLCGEKISDGNFFIQYRLNKMDKKIRTAGPDDVNLRDIANNNIGNDIVKKDILFERYVINTLYRFQNDYGLFRFLIKRPEKYLNDYVLKQIDRYFEALNGSDENLKHFYFRKVCESMSSYKIIRNIEDGINEYEKKRKMKCDENPFQVNKTKILKFETEEDGQMRLF
ncbi:MAG: hypothetical protein IKJ43_03145 [Bacilli bacterium]|nr:hypothetical protein [Bacilli bacterium]